MGRIRPVGYDSGRVYPLSGPDLDAARRLAGAKRRRAMLLMPCDFSASGAAGVLRSNLARIGIEVRIVRQRAARAKHLARSTGLSARPHRLHSKARA